MKKPPTSGAPHPDEVRDYRRLLERWLAVVSRVPGLSLGIYAEAGGYPLAVVRTEKAEPGVPSLYLSAGIHGDEPAPVEGLIRWAEEAPEELGRRNWIIFPCLNPWGLERNIRFDAEGRDLNRCFNLRRVPQITAQLAVMKGRRFDVAACLHEDYDARGFYLYEIRGARRPWGEGLREALASRMRPDDRRRIDGHAARHGIIRRRIAPALMKGHPEAFLLHFRHADRTFTLETPSEHDLAGRVALHRSFPGLLIKKLKSRGGKEVKNR